MGFIDLSDGETAYVMGDEPEDEFVTPASPEPDEYEHNLLEWEDCHVCYGTGRVGSKTCFNCAGSGREQIDYGPPVGDLGDDETWGERNERLLARNAAQRDHDRFAFEPTPEREHRRLIARFLVGDELPPDRRVRRDVLGPRFRSGDRVRPPGRPPLVVDRAGLRDDLAAAAAASGYALADFARPAGPGRPSPAERERLDLLAVTVARLRDRYPLTAIAVELGRLPARVHALCARGRVLLGPEPESEKKLPPSK